MARRDLSYRSLTQELYEDIGIDEDLLQPSFSFMDGDELYRLKTGQDSKAFYIDDKNADWDPKRDGLIVDLTFEISDASLLFLGDEAIAYSSSELSIVAFAVSSSSSDQRMVGISKIDNTDQVQTCVVRSILEKEKYHGIVEFNYYLVVTKPGKREPDKFGINNALGIKLGKVCSFKVRMTADGSSFPVREQPSDEYGLWKTIASWQSVIEDQFDETFMLVLNPKHPDFQYIDRKNTAHYCPRLENEIMAEALADFLIRIQNDSEYKDGLGEVFPEGSVAAIAQYMVETKGIDLYSSSESILHQVVSVFEKEAQQ